MHWLPLKADKKGGRPEPFIAIESLDGLDRYWGKGSTLSARLGSDFGDSVARVRYAQRENGRLFNVLKKPMKVVVCRKGGCRDYYHELPVKLPERNERSVAVTGGWNTAFTKRSVTGRDRLVLLKEALNHTVWNLQAEVATGRLSGRLQGFYGVDARGGSRRATHPPDPHRVLPPRALPTAPTSGARPGQDP